MLSAAINRFTRWFFRLSNTSARPSDIRLRATLAFDESITSVAGVSSKRACELQRMGMRRVRDLLQNFPRRYIDMSCVCKVAEAPIGRMATIAGVVHEVKLKKPKPRLKLVEISVIDETGVIIVTAFNQPWLKDKLHAGERVALSGKVEFDYGFKRMTNPIIEHVQGEVSGLILSVHPTGGGISQKQMRSLIRSALQITSGALDPLPLELRQKYRLMSRQTALRCVHFPHTMQEAAQARRRLAFEELLYVQLLMMTESAKRVEGLVPCSHTINGKRVLQLSDALPFELSAGQEKAKRDLLHVMSKPSLANHMILGDVGTGKTVVAAFGMAAAVDSGGQVLMLAPTEVLAEQHARTLGDLFACVGIRVGLLTGSTSSNDRMRILNDLSSGNLDVLIGTHALMEDDVVPANCTLVVIDEQQRFGVDQRASLLSKGAAPDALYLTATPIPRTMALALFGNMTLSYIKDRPKTGSGRQTYVLSRSDRGKAYDAAKEALAQGQQVYVVCPLVGLNAQERNEAAQRHSYDEDDCDFYPQVTIEGAHGDPDASLTAAVEEASFLSRNVFPDYRVELMYGGMPSDEKRAVMQRFANGEVNVLVTTTVVEVGIDVPNATVMIIEDADRFGLSQLHQLRGRVGRGDKPGQVFLVSASKKEGAIARLSALQRTDDGFELAEEDLAMRREGDILGNRQSGASALKLVNVIRDAAMIEEAHNSAAAILQADPYLQDSENAALAREMRSIFTGEQYEYAVIGG